MCVAVSLARRWRRNRASGFTLIELLLVIGIIATIAALALPGLLRARLSSNEASAIGSLRAINSAESTYSSACGGNGFAQTLEDLAKPASGSNQGFISPDVATTDAIKSGYVISLRRDTSASIVAPASATCNGSSDPSVSGYFAESHPIDPGVTGQRSFATDTTASIFYREDGATITPGMAGAQALR